jgi:hypothetical protein
LEVLAVVVEPIWFKWATFDEDGFVNGIDEDAPEDAKAAYEAEQAEKQRAMDNGEMIPR